MDVPIADLAELGEAVRAARECCDVPVIASEAVSALEGLGAECRGPGVGVPGGRQRFVDSP